MRDRLCDAGLEFVAEIVDGRLQRLDRSRCVRTEGAAGAQESAQLLERLDVAGPALAALERCEQLHAPGQAVAAGRAPAAGFARKELFEVAHHAERMLRLSSTTVMSPVPRRLPALAIVSKSIGEVQVLGHQEIGRCAAGQPALELESVLHAAGMLLENLARGDAERQFPEPRTLDAAAHAIELGARILALALRQPVEPVGAAQHDVRHVAQRLDIVDHGGLAP